MPSEPLRREPEFADEAISDLEAIEEYIFQDNPTAARNLIERIRDVCCTLADNPYMGVARPPIWHRPPQLCDTLHPLSY